MKGKLSKKEIIAIILASLCFIIVSFCIMRFYFIDKASDYNDGVVDGYQKDTEKDINCWLYHSGTDYFILKDDSNFWMRVNTFSKTARSMADSTITDGAFADCILNTTTISGGIAGDINITVDSIKSINVESLDNVKALGIIKETKPGDNTIQYSGVCYYKDYVVSRNDLDTYKVFENNKLIDTFTSISDVDEFLTKE